MSVPWLEIIGRSILMSSIQFSIGSVSMSSIFSVTNFCTDQKTLDSAMDALVTYLAIGCLWAVGQCLLLYSEFKWEGALVALLFNLIIMGWITASYIRSFKGAVKEHNLKMPAFRFM